MKGRFLVVLIPAIFCGCASLGDLFTHTQIVYNTPLIEAAEADAPPVLWIHPDPSDVARIVPPNSLANARYPEPLDPTSKGVEPPYIIELALMPDGDLVCLSPTAFSYQTREGETGFHEFNVPIAERFVLFALDAETGEEQWSVDIEARGLAQLLVIGTDTVLLTVLDHDIRGVNTGGSFHTIDTNRESIVFEHTFEGPLSGFALSRDGRAMLFGVGQMSDGGLEEPGQLLQVDWLALEVETGRPILALSVEPDVLTASRGNTFVTSGDIVNMYDFSTGDKTAVLPDVDATGSILHHRETLLFVHDASLTLCDLQNPTQLATLARPDGRVQSFRAIGPNQVVLHSETSVITPPERRRRPINAPKVSLWDSIEEVFVDYEEATATLQLAEISSGAEVWSVTIPQRIMSEVAVLDDTIAVASPDTLYVISQTDGTPIHQIALPWNDFFAPDAVYSSGDLIVVESEFHVAAFDQESGEMQYDHVFPPLWDSISSSSKALDERAGFWMLENVVGVDFGKSWIEMTSESEADWRASEAQAYADSNRKIDMSRQPVNTRMNTRWMNPSYDVVSGQLVYDSSSVYLIDSAVGSFQANMATIAAMTMWTRETMRQVYGSLANNNRMAYPYVLHEINKIGVNDRPGRIVRLTGAGENKAIAVLEVLDTSDGSVTSVPLSPRQAPPPVDATLATGAYKIGIYGGYLPYIPFLYHSFRTIVDWENDRIFHYGPGLDSSLHILFDDKGNYRSMLWAYDVEL